MPQNAERTRRIQIVIIEQMLGENRYHGGSHQTNDQESWIIK